VKKSDFIKRVLKSRRNTVFVNKEQVENSIMVLESLGMLPPSCEVDKYTSWEPEDD